MILFLRAIAAVAFTGLISPLLFSAGFAAFYSIETGIALHAEPVVVVAFYGTFVALPFALVLGLFVECPKLFWHRKGQGIGLLAQLLVSVVGAWSLLFLFVTITEGTFPEFDQPAEEYFFLASAFTIGGFTSGSAWWALVARHTLAKKSTAR